MPAVGPADAAVLLVVDALCADVHTSMCATLGQPVRPAGRTRTYTEDGRTLTALLLLHEDRAVAFGVYHDAVSVAVAAQSGTVDVVYRTMCGQETVAAVLQDDTLATLQQLPDLSALELGQPGRLSLAEHAALWLTLPPAC